MLLEPGPEVEGAAPATPPADLTPVYEAFQDESKTSILAGIGAKGTLFLEHTDTPKVLASTMLDKEPLNASWHHPQL